MFSYIIFTLKVAKLSSLRLPAPPHLALPLQ